MTLEDKLRKLNDRETQKTETDWELYKKGWLASIKKLENMLMYKWFEDYDKKGLMVFGIVPVKRVDPYIGEYLTTNLEITLPNNQSFVLEPVSAITSEYDGKVEFYMRGNVYKNITIARKLAGKHDEWIIAKSYDPKTHYKLEKKEQIEKIISEWLS